MAFQIAEVQKAGPTLSWPTPSAAWKGLLRWPNAVMKALKGSLTGSND